MGGTVAWSVDGGCVVLEHEIRRRILQMKRLNPSGDCCEPRSVMKPRRLNARNRKRCSRDAKKNWFVRNYLLVIGDVLNFCYLNLDRRWIEAAWFKIRYIPTCDSCCAAVDY